MLAVLIAIGALHLGCAEQEVPLRAVHVLTIDGAIDHVTPRYLARGIERAEQEEAAAVLIRIDTPGGSSDGMRGAVSAIEQARIPVITWVGPPGAQAASAGTFVAMAGHVAAMAPGTTIGAATPITATGEDIEGDLGQKVQNDAAAFARGVAALRGRNVEWAEKAVREAISATGPEAVELDVVDFVAEDESALLAAAHGRDVQLPGGATAKVAVQGAPLVRTDVNGYERVLRFMGNPFVVGLLFLIGLGLIWVEFNAPGMFVPGAIGLLLVVLALLGVGAFLPEDAAIAAIGAGVVLILLELVVPGGVVGAIGGIAILVGLAVFATSSTALDWRLLLTFTGIAIVGVSIGAGIALIFLARRYIADSEQSQTKLV
jgi:membrane-bound serine protease (ClpP class)